MRAKIRNIIRHNKKNPDRNATGVPLKSHQNRRVRHDVDERIASSIRLVRFTFERFIVADELNTIADIRSGLFLIRRIIADPFFVHLDNRPVKNLDVIQTFSLTRPLPVGEENVRMDSLRILSTLERR